ncbi:histone-lysine N-methyltransferase 2D [Drosophila obscura]|uniref:histone-lysine N-methyltransferase 2D n=1 Tax=Drosophila obscura TaxID=7282 RepID=UPI001BB21873|nr:histone-lysine N-methyltransferase 2D [Drosophila obscura]
MKRSKDEDKEDSASATSNLNSSTGSNSNDAAATVGTASAAAAVRTTGRVKKPKQVYDPSDNYVSRGARNSTPANATVQASHLPAPATAAVPVPVPVTPPVAVTVPKPEVVATSDAQDVEFGQPGQPLRQFDVCQKCSKMEVKRGSGHKSNFLACKSCQQKWHFNCLPLKFDVLAVARKKYKCPACRYCRVCGTKGKDLAICSECVYSYHRDCHDPPLAASISGRKSHTGRKRRAQSDPAGQEQSPPTKQAKLQQESKQQSTKADADSVSVAATALEPATKNGEPKQEEKLKKGKVVGKGDSEREEINEETNEEPELNLDEPEQEQLDENGPENQAEGALPEGEPNEESEMPLENMDQQPLEAAVPTASDDDEIIIVSVQLPPEPPTDAEPMSPVCTWTVEQVTTYLARFYPNEAQAFNIQDVDGTSLMLLTREDVINGFGFKLGPALRVFQVILSLQSRTNSVDLGWSST